MIQSQTHTHMFCLRGSAALSQFRIEKILAKLAGACPNITHLYAEFQHFAWVDTQFSGRKDYRLDLAQQKTLQQILTYGPTMQK